MAKPAYKLLALDIDGTLVKDHTNEVSPVVKNALNQIKKKVVISLISARAGRDQKIILDQLDLTPTYHALENGTRVINPQGKLEYTKFLPLTGVQHIQTLTQELCESIGFCIEGQWLPAYDVASKPQITTLSLIAKADQAEKIPSLLDQLPESYAITVGNHWSDPSLRVALISHQDASKGGGLRFIQNALSITPAETIAIGDGASDVPMMKYAGLKVAMGNAEEKLKKIADFIAPSVDENGVAAVIEKYLLST